MIQRNNLAGMIPEPVSREIFQGVVEQSAVLKAGRRLPNMTSKTQSINVLDMLPMAYWVEGDTGYKETGGQAWEKKRLYAVKPRIVEAMGRRIDEAVLFGIGKPSTWRDSIVDTAKAAGNSVTETTGANADLFADIMGEGGVIAKAEESGYMPTGVMAAVQMRARLRGLTDKNGQPIFISGALMVVGDFHQLVYSIRQDVTYKVLTEATIVDPGNKQVVYSLAQQDMVALRAVMRLGWEIPNPISSYRETLARYSPFAVYLPAD